MKGIQKEIEDAFSSNQYGLLHEKISNIEEKLFKIIMKFKLKDELFNKKTNDLRDQLLEIINKGSNEGFQLAMKSNEKNN